MSVRRDGQERRDALLDAALRCFARAGVLGTGIEAIRKEAGASPSSVYHQFPDVRALTMALLLRTLERLFAHLAARVVPVAADPEALVTALVGAHVEWVLAHAEEARFMYQALTLETAPDAGAALVGEKARMLLPIVDAFAPHIASGALPPWSPLHFDVVLLGPAHESCRRWLGGAALDPAWMRAELPRLAWRSLGVMPAPAPVRRPAAKTKAKVRARG